MGDSADLSSSLANVNLIDGTIVRPLDVLSDVRDSDMMTAISLARYRKYTVDVAVAFVIHALAALATASAKGAGRRQRERDRLADSLGLYLDGL